MRRIFILSLISLVFAAAAIVLLSSKPSLTRKATAQKVKNLRYSAAASPQHRFDTLQSLVERSPEIVVGVPTNKSSYRRSPEDRMVFTDYVVQVVQTLRGDRHENRKLTLRVPGGSLSADNGQTQEVTMPGFWKNPELGKGYILFLTRPKGSPSVLVGGPQGAFEISPWLKSDPASKEPANVRQVVTPLVRESDTLMANYKGQDVQLIIEQIRQIIETLNATPERAALN